MTEYEYLEADLHSCKLCEWRCGVDRLGGEIGVCGITIPLVASSQLHPAPPSSFDAFLVGCNFRCLFCQNWSISMYEEPSPGCRTVNDNITISELEGYYPPHHWAELALAALTTLDAQLIQADRLFFTGGEPTCSLPWVEKVVTQARTLIPGTKINYDTNGFLTQTSLKRVLAFASSITYDLKAFNPQIFKSLTGANVKPVLRNLKYIINNAIDQLWEVRVMVIPGVHDHDVEILCGFIADIDQKVKLNFLAFRPNFVMENHPGADEEYLENCVRIAKDAGLENVTWSGRPGFERKIPEKVMKILEIQNNPGSEALPQAYAESFGCTQDIRNCGKCSNNRECAIKNYTPTKIT
jgi:pyruvate formate lyase activating enzyme